MGNQTCRTRWRDKTFKRSAWIRNIFDRRKVVWPWAPEPRLSTPWSDFKMSAGAKEFTSEEVGQHASAASCYFVIEGIVYDVTKFLSSVSSVFDEI